MNNNDKLINSDDNNKEVRNRIIRFIIGLIVSIIACIGLYETSPNSLLDWISNVDSELKRFMLPLLSSFVLLLGMILMVSSFDLKIDEGKYSLGFLIGAFFTACILSTVIRNGVLIILSTFVLFIFLKIYKRVFSTLVTFITGSYVTLFVVLVLNHFKLSLEVNLYCSLSIYFLVYNIFGIKINQVFLRAIFGDTKISSKEYDTNQLKNDINFMYLVFFVLYNVIFRPKFPDVSDIINNAFLTGVCITNLNWKKLSSI